MVRPYQALLIILYLLFFMFAAKIVVLHFLYQEFIQPSFFGSLGGVLLCGWGFTATVSPAWVARRRSVLTPAVLLLASFVIVCGVLSVIDAYQIGTLTQSEKLRSVLTGELPEYFIFPGIVIVHLCVLVSVSKRLTASS